jgi:flagellar biosynthesis protein FlhA
VPGLLSLGQVVRVLQNLLREGISVRDLRTILETLADHAGTTRDVEVLTEYVRHRLARAITQRVLCADGVLRVAVLEPSIEDKLRASVQIVGAETVLAADPSLLQEILRALESLSAEFAARGGGVVLVVSAELRRHLRGVIDRFLPQVAVLSHREVDPRATIETIAAVP